MTIRWNRLDETIPTNGHNIGFGGEIKKYHMKNPQENKNICSAKVNLETVFKTFRAS